MENILTQELPSNLTFDRQAYKWNNDVISVPALCTILSFVNTEQGIETFLSDKPLKAPVSEYLEKCESHKIGFVENRFIDFNDLREKQEFIAYSNATLGDGFISIDLEPYWAEVKDEWIELKGFQHLAETSDGICDLDGISSSLIMEVMNFTKQQIN